MRISKRYVVIFGAFVLSLGGYLNSVQADSTDLPGLEDARVPSNIKPSLQNIKLDRPTPYRDHCHVQQNLLATDNPCVYGDTTSSTTIVLFGDSHALSWFPAIERLALAKHWKLISLTMSSCWPADIPAYNPKTKITMNNCSLWRKNTLKQILKIRPSWIFVTGTKGFATTGKNGQIAIEPERTTIWRTGMASTLQTLKSASSRVIYIGDTPNSIFDVPACLSSNLHNYANCATPFWNAVDTDWTLVEQGVARDSGVKFVDPTFWICKSDPCSPLDVNRQIYIDATHLSATFSVTLERPLWASVSSLS